MTGVRLDLDLNDKVGVLLDGRVDLEGGMHLDRGDDREGRAEDFTLTEGTITACEGETPAWKFSCRAGLSPLEEYARLNDATFRFGGVPLL